MPLPPLNHDVYVAGDFSTVGGVTMNSFARWDGNNWSALGSGVTTSGGTQPGTVFALSVSGTNLYVGGFFTAAGGLANYGLARWNGTSWSQPGGVGCSGTVRAMAANGTNFYIAGTFSAVGAPTPTGGTNATNIARWDGTAWSALGPGVNGTGMSLATAGETRTRQGVAVASRASRGRVVEFTSLVRQPKSSSA